MDWNNYKKSYEDITGEVVEIKRNKSNGINDLTNYKLITRENIDDLEIGCHIKYIKNVFDIETNKLYEKTYNGGFLVEIVDGDKIHTLTLVLKSNITWKMKYIKYKVYAKAKKDFYKQENENKQFEDHFRNDNIEEINERKKEIDKRVQDKLKNIQKQNKKNHFVLFKDDAIKLNISDSDSDSDSDLDSNL